MLIGTLPPQFLDELDVDPLGFRRKAREWSHYGNNVPIDQLLPGEAPRSKNGSHFTDTTRLDKVIYEMRDLQPTIRTPDGIANRDGDILLHPDWNCRDLVGHG